MLVPGFPVEGFAVPFRGEFGVAVPSVGEPVEAGSVGVGQPVIVVASVGRGCAVGVHFGDEGEFVGEREIPDGQFHLEFDGFAVGGEDE